MRETCFYKEVCFVSLIEFRKSCLIRDSTTFTMCQVELNYGFESLELFCI